MLTLMFALVILITIIFFVFGNLILENLLQFDFIQDYAAQMILGLRFLIIGILFYIIVSSIYFFAPAVKKRFSFFSIGSLIATILIIVVSQAFSYYVNNFGNYNKLYGSIGALIGLMVLFYAISYMILLGFQINASIDGALEHELEAEKKKDNNITE